MPAELQDRMREGHLVAGRYRVEALMGAGGTSEVWRGRDDRLGRRVAIKVLKPQMGMESIAARVEREARAAALLRHPAIVEIYDVGELDSGLPFVVMEYLVGRMVKDLIDARGRLAPVDAVSMLLPIADALAAAHEVSTIHRDVKPENIFVSRLDRGILQPKLVDFGVARVAQQQSQRLTAAGTVVGTPLYMPPEQSKGDAGVGAPADVWALGVTLFEALTGRLPFEGDTIQSLFANILAAPIPYPRDIEDFDPALFSILADATRKMPSERSTADQLVQDFVGWLRGKGVDSDLSGRSVSSYLQSRTSSRPPAPSPAAARTL